MSEIQLYEGTAIQAVRKKEDLNGLYCSYRAFQGRLWSVLESNDITTDYFTERTYFKSLEKIGVLVRGTIQNKELRPNRKSSNLFPPEPAFSMMIDDDDSVFGIYRRKRGTWGFNCDDTERLDKEVLHPLVKLYENAGAELDKQLAPCDKAHPEYEEKKSAVEALGMTMSDYKNHMSKKILEKLV